MRVWIDADACPNVIKEILFRAAERAKIVKQMWSADGKNAPEVSWAEVNRIANTGYQSFDDAFGGKAEREDVIALVKRGKYRLRRNT